MKTEHAKTPQNREQVSSHRVKKGIGAKKAIGTPPVSEKNRGRTGKKACKSVEQDENEQNYKKVPRRSWATNQMGNPDL
jgi:hypothetical protein